MSRVGILQVDVFESWRRLVAAMFRPRPELEIICKSSGGQKQVRRRGLLPDLILIDLGLPAWNGLEAGQQIRAFPPIENHPLDPQKSVYIVCRHFAQVHRIRNQSRDWAIAIDAVLQGKDFSIADFRVWYCWKRRKRELRFPGS